MINVVVVRIVVMFLMDVLMMVFKLEFEFEFVVCVLLEVVFGFIIWLGFVRLEFVLLILKIFRLFNRIFLVFGLLWLGVILIFIFG